METVLQVPKHACCVFQQQTESRMMLQNSGQLRYDHLHPFISIVSFTVLNLRWSSSYISTARHINYAGERDCLKYYLNFQVSDECGTIPCVLVQNKIDLIDEAVVQPYVQYFLLTCSVAFHPNAPLLCYLLCLIPDYFTSSNNRTFSLLRESAGSQWVNLPMCLVNTLGYIQGHIHYAGISFRIIGSFFETKHNRQYFQKASIIGKSFGIMSFCQRNQY